MPLTRIQLVVVQRLDCPAIISCWVSSLLQLGLLIYTRTVIVLYFVVTAVEERGGRAAKAPCIRSGALTLHRLMSRSRPHKEWTYWV